MMMNSIPLLLLLLFLPLPVPGFLPQQQAPASFALNTKFYRDEMAAELEESLGEEIQRKVMQSAESSSAASKDPTVLKLKHEIQEQRNAMLEFQSAHFKAMKEMESKVESLALMLKTEEALLNQEEKELNEYKEEHESVFRLLGDAAMLALRRTARFLTFGLVGKNE